MEGHSCDGASERWEDHARVPCYHVLSRCTPKVSLVNNHPSHHHDHKPHDFIQCRHQQHHQHHYHHHHELHSSTSSSSLASTKWISSASLESISLNRLLTLFVFLLSWAAVCASPRRMGGIATSRYNSETNSLQMNPNSSQSIAAIPSVESLPQSPLRSSEAANLRASLSISSSSPSAPSSEKTGREPGVDVPAVDFLPLNSAVFRGSFPPYMSQRVAFSVERPQTPPWPDDFTFAPNAAAEGDSSSATHSRRRRSLINLEAVCLSTSTWETKAWGIDMYGNNVTILPRIMSAGRREVRQWFYETTCTHTEESVRQECRGINEARYESFCMAKNAWVYAMVRTSRGEEGWLWIAISSSCNCAIRELTLMERFRRIR